MLTRKLLTTSVAALAAAALAGTAHAALIIPAGTIGTTGATGLYLDSLSEISTSDPGATAADLLAFLGAPDDEFRGLGGAWIQYDMGAYRLTDGSGADFTVYEYNSGSVEFNEADILVSLDGSTWYNIEADTAAYVDLAGDELHGSASFRRSYDITNALAALGVTELRYVRLDGTNSGNTITASSGFDPDAVGFIHYSSPPAVPEPASWALMLLGIGVVGSVLRRRRADRVQFA